MKSSRVSPGALNAQLVAARGATLGTAPTPDSMDLYFQGLAWFNRGATPDNVVPARSFFDRALIADPDNVDALVGSARADATEGALMFVAVNPAFGAAEAKINQSLVVSPGPCARTSVFGICRHVDQARRRRHRRM